MNNTAYHYRACSGCDLLYQLPQVHPGQLVCPRCGTTLQKTPRNSVERVLALSSAGLLLYFPAMLLPLMTLKSAGFSTSGNVVQTGMAFFTAGFPIVGSMVVFTAVLFPLAKLLFSFIVSLQIRRNKRSQITRKLLKILLTLEEWGMIEIYLLGILVSLIKVHNIAAIEYGIGFLCFIILVILSIATSVSTDKNLFWTQLDEDSVPLAIPEESIGRETAAQQQLFSCHHCNLLTLKTENNTRCSRCGTRLHTRKPRALERTWALLVTSLLFIVPANVLPIMQVKFLGFPDNSTIIDGIIHFFNEGSYGIGLIIFLASVLVPLFKIIGLLILLFTIHRKKNRFLKQKTKMFHFIAFIGRWSMLDIFVIALITVLVDFGLFTSVHTAPGASFFCAVVVCTMLAAIVFDPRIMWDRCLPISQNTHHRNTP